MQYAPIFNDLLSIYRATPVEFPQLKPASVAMWILESARGASELAAEHLNFAGMKWRTEMKPYGRRVNYDAHDGDGYYCKFNSLSDFIAGYWRFLDRSPYDGWRDHVATPEAFLQYIAPTWAGDAHYAEKTVALLGEARGLLAGDKVTATVPPVPDDDILPVDDSAQPTLIGPLGMSLSPDGKQLSCGDSLPIEYRGKDDCPYGRSATASKAPFRAIVLHHNSPVHTTDWYVGYQIDGDHARGGHFGYHIYVAPDGRVIQGAPMSVRTNQISAAPQVRRDFGRFATNSNAIGISCCEAGIVEGDRTIGSKPTKAQNIAVFHLVWMLCDLYDIPFGHVFGHGEIQTTRHKSEGAMQAQTVRSWQA